jgi:hypothetical protein
MRTRLTRSVAVLAVAVLLTASTPLLAAPASGLDGFVSSFGLHLDQVWTGVLDLFTKGGGLMDPNGVPDDDEDPTDGTNSGGGMMDPNGAPNPDPNTGSGG